MRDEILEALGLTYNEAKIYLCLNEYHELSASDITKKVGIHRRNVYDALNRLEVKGLTKQTWVNNKVHFSAVHPRQLLRILEENKNKIERIVPSLTQKFEQQSIERSVNIYRGIKGIKACFNESLDMMKKKESYIAIGCIDMKELLGIFIESHREERAKKQIETWTLFNDKFKDRAALVAKNKNHHVRVLPKSYFLPVQTVIFGKSVVCEILIHEEPFAIQVIDTTFAANYKRYFEMLWGISSKVH